MSNEFPRNGGPGTPELARREDFQLGAALIRPSLRMVEGPLERVSVEPRVMQVLVVLADAGGAVRSRDDLMRACWPGMVVGEDAVNRTIAEIRRVARRTGAGFNVETIPKVGFRLATSAPAAADPPPAATADAGEQHPDPLPTARRWVIGGTLAAAVVVVGLGFRCSTARRPPPEFERLMAQGQAAIFNELPVEGPQSTDYLEEAVRLQPDSAAAWGLLALAWWYRAWLGVEGARTNALDAVNRALRLDSREPNARVAQAMAQRDPFDAWTTEQRLRAVLQDFPDNPSALDCLSALLQSAGDVDQSWAVGEKALQVDAETGRPLRMGPAFRQALKLWIKGDKDRAEQAAASALREWPGHQYVWGGALVIRAFTGRGSAARQMLEQDFAQAVLGPAGVEAWRKSLIALETSADGDIQTAAQAIHAGIMAGQMPSGQAAMLLSALGEVDAAYEVLDGLLVRKGQLLAPAAPLGDSQLTARDPGWLEAHFLFTPPMQAVHADPRFAKLRREIGLESYWNKRGETPPVMPWLRGSD